jgi:hypothetical protein
MPLPGLGFDPAVMAGAQQWCSHGDAGSIDPGPTEVAMSACYQVSLAIDADDPQFAAKCRGRGIDPEQTRQELRDEGKLVAPSSLRPRNPKPDNPP